MPYEKMRKETLGAKALSINPPATITPLNTATGRAPKFTTQMLQTGPGGEERGEGGRGGEEEGGRGGKGGERRRGGEGERGEEEMDEDKVLLTLTAVL